MYQYFVLVLISVIADKAYSDTNYRLNTTIKPKAYSIAITPYFDTGDDHAFTFDGEIDINFITEAATRQIKLHSEELSYNASNIAVANGAQNLNLDASDPLQFDANYTFAFINLQEDLLVGVEYTLKITYKGPIRTDLSGFYRNYYIEQGVKSVNPNLRRHVFCEGLRAGGYEEWKFLFDRKELSNNQADEVVMLRALGCTTNDQARHEYLNMILNDDIVKAQDRENAFTFLMMGDRSNANVVLQFLKANIDEIRRGMVLQTSFNSVISNLAAYLDEDGLKDMESWLQVNQNNIPEYSLGISSVTSARNNQAWGTLWKEVVLKAAKGSAITVLPTTMLLLSTCMALMLK